MIACMPPQGQSSAEESKCPTNSQGLESAIKLAEDAGVIAADVEHFVTLQVQVSVQGLDEQVSRCLQDVEGPGS